MRTNPVRSNPVGANPMRRKSVRRNPVRRNSARRNSVRRKSVWRNPARRSSVRRNSVRGNSAGPSVLRCPWAVLPWLRCPCLRRFVKKEQLSKVPVRVCTLKRQQPMEKINRNSVFFTSALASGVAGDPKNKNKKKEPAPPHNAFFRQRAKAFFQPCFSGEVFFSPNSRRGRQKGQPAGGPRRHVLDPSFSGGNVESRVSCSAG